MQAQLFNVLKKNSIVICQFCIILLLLTSCKQLTELELTELEKINTNYKQITITGIPDIHDGKMFYICLHDQPSNSNYYSHTGIHGEGRISNNSITVSLKTGSIEISWQGLGSFYISFRVPLSRAIIGIPDNSNSEEFRYIEGEFNIKDTISTIQFSEFIKVN